MPSSIIAPDIAGELIRPVAEVGGFSGLSLWGWFIRRDAKRIDERIKANETRVLKLEENYLQVLIRCPSIHKEDRDRIDGQLQDLREEVGALRSETSEGLSGVTDHLTTIIGMVGKRQEDHA